MLTPRETHVSNATKGNWAGPSVRLTPYPSGCWTEPAHDTMQSLSFKYVLNASEQSEPLQSATEKRDDGV